MKKRFYKLTALLLAVMLTVSMFTALPLNVSAAETVSESAGASSGTTGDCTWTLDDNGTLTISGNGAMGDYSFSASAPWGTKVKNVIINWGVTSIGEYAFAYCMGLTNITIPGSVMSIGDGVFYLCSSLSKVNISDLSAWCNIDFADDGYSTPFFYARNLYLNDELITNLVIPNSVTSIGDYAFEWCTGLKSVTIPNSVTSYGAGAFEDCTGLTSITISDGVTSIGSFMFSGCTGLTSVTIPDSITSIGSEAFNYCTGLTKVNISDLSAWCNIDFDDCFSNPLYYAHNLYLNSELITELVIPNSVTSIGDYAFERCTGLTSVTIPNSVTSIGDSAFSGCTGLTRIIVDDNNAFYDSRENCNALIETSSNELLLGCKCSIIPYGVASICSNAFNGCTGLTSITFPDSVTSIGASAFRGCTGLTSVTIGNGVTIIDSYAFYYCTELTSVTISNSVTSIGFVAFCGCKKLTSVTIPKSVTSIGTHALGYSEFEGNKTNGFTIYGESDSAAEVYAEANGFDFILIGEAKPISECTVTLSPTSYIYDGNAKTPSVTVKDGTKTLTADTDYTVAYANNTNVGTATVTVTGKGNYTGTASATFTITQASQDFVWGQDNWSFDNSGSYFSNYNVNSTVLATMKQDFGLTNSQLYELKNAINEDNYYGFQGSCFGMTVSEIMVKHGDLNLTRYGGNSIVNRNSNTSNMTSVINFIQELQSVSGYSQLIRQAPFISGSNSQYDFIDKAESVLSNEKILVKISYGIRYLNKNTGQYSSAGYHAVLGYGIESCNYYSSVTGKTYDKRILIADPNYLSRNTLYGDSCIYYKSSDHSWICPYWNVNRSSDAYLCYWNASSGSSTHTGMIRNIMKYNSLTDTVDLMADYSVSHYISGLTVDNKSGNATTVEQIRDTGNPNLDYAGSAGSGIAQYNIEMDDSYNVKDSEEFYALWNPTANYSVSYSKPSDFNLKMDYEDVLYYGEVENGTYSLMKPSGYFQLRGSNMAYSVTMLTDDSECVTDWYALSVSGDGTDSLTFSKRSNGYVLTSSNLENVTIKAENNDVEVSRTFSAGFNSVFIYEIDENTIGLKVDADKNGTYETLLPSGSDSYYVGDADKNGTINVNDVTAIQKHIAKLDVIPEEWKVFIDTNSDGVINIIDATALQKKIAGLS